MPTFLTSREDDDAQLHTQPFDSDDEREESSRGAGPVRRIPHGGYHSHVEKLLYEHPELPILITDAGKSMEGNGKYTVYTIRTAVRLSVCIIAVLCFPITRFIFFAIFSLTRKLLGS